MEIEELFGLPAHPLVVHAVVVLVPLAAFGTVLAVCWRGARGALLWATCALALLAAVLTPLATGSGEELEREVEETELVEDHAATGDRMIPLAAGLFAGSAALLGTEEYRKRRPRHDDSGAARTAPVPPWVVAAVSVLAVVTALAATAQVVIAGHSGAKATWSDVGDERDERDDPGAPDRDDGERE